MADETLTEVDPAKDYYSLLGVTHSADTTVIRAAYKALAQKYHPDRHMDDESAAQQTMAELSEAYAVLSDPRKRSKYDSLRGNDTFEEATTFEEDAGEEPDTAEDVSIERAWNTASEYYPQLLALEARLAKASKPLASEFKTRVVESKAYHDASTLALTAETAFLESYFGANEGILDFARLLVLSGNKAAARDLNTAIKVLGEGTDSGTIIAGIRRKYQLSPKVTGVVSTAEFASLNGETETDLIDRVSSGAIEGVQLGPGWYEELDDKQKLIKKRVQEPWIGRTAPPSRRFLTPLLNVIGIATLSVFLFAVVLALV